MGNMYIGSTPTNLLGRNTWVRPADWLPVPATGSQEFAGLYAIYPHDSNFVALSASVTGGTPPKYNIDWGNGTSSVYGSTTASLHNYVYTNINASSGSSRGYRQAWIRVTPSGSGVLNTVNLQVRHTQSALPAVQYPNWLEVIYNTPNLIQIATQLGGPTTCVLHMLENATINSFSSSINTLAQTFYNCITLKNVNLFDTSKITDFTGMFQNCRKLQMIPKFNTSSGSIFTDMMRACNSLIYMPLLDTSAATNFSTMFRDCFSLTYLPLFDARKVTTVSGICQTCYALETVPAFNFLSCSTFTSMFNTCTSLKTVPLFSGSAGTVFAAMFSSCASLINVPLINTAKATDMSSMFNACTSLTTVPPLSAVSCSALASIFGATPNLRVGALSGSKASIDYTSHSLSYTEILSIFNNLNTASAASITMSGNWGSSSLTPSDTASIAARGWTVKF